MKAFTIEAKGYETGVVLAESIEEAVEKTIKKLGGEQILVILGRDVPPEREVRAIAVGKNPESDQKFSIYKTSLFIE